MPLQRMERESAVHPVPRRMMNLDGRGVNVALIATRSLLPGDIAMSTPRLIRGPRVPAVFANVGAARTICDE
jgi:hypothetical protein